MNKTVSVLNIARREAVLLGRLNGYCDSDQVQERLLELGYNSSDLGNAAGSIFKDNCWLFTGKIKQSRRAGNRARMIRVWKFIPQNDRVWKT